MSDADGATRLPRRIASHRRSRPQFSDEMITASHGAGGKAQSGVVDAVFLEAYGNDTLRRLEDGAVVEVAPGLRVAFSCDAFVVTPHRFPGGSIGRLAVCGTVNDLAVMGADPAWLSIAYVLEEGCRTDDLRRVAGDVADAAAEAGVEIVAGDTKVVAKGDADGLYITTSGIGVVPPGRELGREHVRVGDKAVVSGPIGDHGVAVMLARDALAIDADVTSDCAPLAAAIRALLEAVPTTRWMRDATRGGLATACCELAAAADWGIVLDEEAVPVRKPVRAACEILGIDPMYVANEGTFLAIVPGEHVETAVETLNTHAPGAGPAVIGEIVSAPKATVVLETGFGGSRMIDMLVGDPLPRIC